MSILNDILRNAVQAKASDVHIVVGAPPLFRIHTVVQPSDFPIVTPEGAKRLAAELMNEKRLAEFEEKRDSDFSYEIPGLSRFRVNAHYQRGSVAFAFRTINDKIRPIEQLFLPEICSKLTYLPRGLILVTGPTGSGKSTTLAAMVDAINRREQGHIITMEDPIEYAFVSNKSIIEQREVGADVPTFASGLKHSLRQDPDVILVGEMRDLETIEAAITAAETGHVVFGTLHTSSAAGTINRIIDVFPAHQQDQIRTQLATAIIGILAQQLLPRIGGGRVAGFETLVVTPGIANLIRENKIFRITSAIQTGSKYGMQLLDDHLFQHWRKELVTKEDVLAKANSPDDLAKRIVAAERGVFDEAPGASEPAA